MKFSNAKRSDIPPQQYEVNPYGFNAKDIRGLLKRIVANNNERVIDSYLRERPSLMGFVSKFFNAGHHGTWIIPQAYIKPPSLNGSGLIPDYLFASRNSDGITWWVVELKSPQQKLYKRNSKGVLSQTQGHLNGVNQLQEYITYCNENQSYIRDALGLSTFTSPYGILITGREKELIEDSGKQKLKATFNRNHRTIQIRTYDAYIRQIQYMINLRSSLPVLNHMLIEFLVNGEITPFDWEDGVANSIDTDYGTDK